MPVTTLSSRRFQQDASGAQRAADDGPVVITNRGRPVHVLLSYGDYRRLTGEKRNLAAALAMPGLSDLEIDVPRSRELTRPADFS